MVFGSVRVLEVSRLGGFLSRRGVVVFKDAVPEVLEIRMVARTGEEALAGCTLCGEGKSEPGQISKGGDGGMVVNVDAGVCLEHLHAEEVGCCGIVFTVSFEEDPPQ